MEKDFIYGNFTSQPDGIFPVDCETFERLQENTSRLAHLRHLFGYNRIILSGCSEEGTNRTEGYVYIEGEILYHEKQTISPGCYIEESPIAVNANNVEYPEAWRRRTLKDGTPDGYIPWTSFTKAEDVSISALLTNPTLAFVSGMIIMWSGSLIPHGWALCDGQQGRPDLRGRFIVGSGGQYHTGDTGGAPSVALTEAQMPKHSHTATITGGRHKHDYYLATSGSHKHTIWQDDQIGKKNSGTTTGTGYDAKSETSGSPVKGYTSTEGGHTHDFNIHDSPSHEHGITIAETGGTAAHENRPPYYALAFIIKL